MLVLPGLRIRFKRARSQTEFAQTAQIMAARSGSVPLPTEDFAPPMLQERAEEALWDRGQLPCAPGERARGGDRALAGGASNPA